MKLCNAPPNRSRSPRIPQTTPRQNSSSKFAQHQTATPYYLNWGASGGEIAKGATSIAFVDPNCTIGIKLDEQLDENGEEIVISFLLQNLPADLSLLFQQHKPTLYKDCRAFSIGSPTKWITLGKSDHKPFDPFNL
jgi:hypothetical protein